MNNIDSNKSSKMNKEYRFLFINIIAKPFDGFYEMRRNKKGSWLFVLMLFILFGIMQILNFTATGYLFNNNDQRDFNVFLVLGTAYIPFILFAIANYAITTLMGGKGFFKDIIKVLGYSLFPLLIAQVLSLIISQFIALDESAFYAVINGIGIVFFVFYCFIGLLVIHEYGFLKGLLAIILTFVGMAIIVFIIILLVSLFQQLIGFITSLIREIRLR